MFLFKKELCMREPGRGGASRPPPLHPPLGFVWGRCCETIFIICVFFSGPGGRGGGGGGGRAGPLVFCNYVKPRARACSEKGPRIICLIGLLPPSPREDKISRPTAYLRNLHTDLLGPTPLPYLIGVRLPPSPPQDKGDYRLE